METQAVSALLTPIIQFGFAGFSVVLLGIIIWLIRMLVQLIRDVQKVILGNTEALNALHAHENENIKITQQTLSLLRDTHDKIISRPCIAKEE